MGLAYALLMGHRSSSPPSGPRACLSQRRYESYSEASFRPPRVSFASPWLLTCPASGRAVALTEIPDSIRQNREAIKSIKLAGERPASHAGVSCTLLPTGRPRRSRHHAGDLSILARDPVESANTRCRPHVQVSGDAAISTRAVQRQSFSAETESIWHAGRVTLFVGRLIVGLLLAFPRAPTPNSTPAPSSAASVDGIGAVLPGRDRHRDARGHQRVLDDGDQQESGSTASLPCRVGRYSRGGRDSGLPARRQTGHHRQRPGPRGVDFVLEVGAVSEEVVVSARAELLQTQSADIGAVVDERQVRDFPLLGRRYAELALLRPAWWSRPPASPAAVKTPSSTPTATTPRGTTTRSTAPTTTRCPRTCRSAAPRSWRRRWTRCRSSRSRRGPIPRSSARPRAP